MDTTTISWIFVAIMAIGVTYLLISIVLGDLIDSDIDAEVDSALDGFDSDASEARGLSCSVISTFLAGFGSVGLLGSLSGFPLILSIIAGIVFGVILGRSLTAVLRYVMRQQSNDLLIVYEGLHLVTTMRPPKRPTRSDLMVDSICCLRRSPMQICKDANLCQFQTMATNLPN